MPSNYRPRRRHGTSGGAQGRSAQDSSGNPNGAGGQASPGGATRRAKSPRPADPRRAAYDVLAAVRDREAYANLLLPKLMAERQLTGRDAALATELAYGTLRGQGTYDAVLAACSDRPLDKLDPPVLDVLRLGAHQLLNTRIGAYAAVATSVDLAKSVVGPRVSGYVNAVLRRVATRDLAAWLDIVAPAAATDRDGYLATRYSHPRWIVAAYRDALGEAADVPVPVAADALVPDEVLSDAPAAPASPGAPVGPEPSAEATGGAAAPTELEAALAAGNARPKVTLATFPAGPPRAEVMPSDATPGRWSPYAFSLASGDPAPLVESGAASVQDEGSQLAAIALSRASLAGQGDGAAERWLDMCAGPGGKSRLLYGLAAGSGATLTAAELHPHRAALVRDALTSASRLMSSSLPSAPPGGTGNLGAAAPLGARGPGFEVVVADGTRPPWPDGTFDRVLVDAPCSGLGALRRRPEARWRKSEADLKDLTELQRDLLRSALTAVRPGGVVGYVTCSPVPAETRDVVNDVAASTPGVEILDAPRMLPDIPGVSSVNPLFAQLWPHRHGTDAIFIALLRRT
jgi:16S rRNA (cytosine967-C5)-methyltransferase